MTRKKALAPAPTPAPAPRKKGVGGWPKGKKRGPKTAEQRAASAPIRPAKLKTTSIDWPLVRNTYVQGIVPEGADALTPRQFLSIAEVAGRFDINVGNAQVRSAQENWPEQREQFQLDLRTREDAILTERLAQQRVRANMAYFGTALRGQQQIDRKLRNDDVSDMALQRLMGALRSSQQVADVAQGRPVDGEGSGGTTNFWMAFTGTPVPAVRDAFLTIDSEAPPAVGVVASPAR